MDDNQTNEQAPDEVLVSEANASEAEAEDNTEAEANTETDEGTADDGEADKSDEDESEDEDEQPRRKKKSGLDRIKRQLEALKIENQTLRSQQAATPPADMANLEQLVRTEIGDPPKESDYPNYLDFERDMIAYKAEERLVRRELRKQIATQTAQRQAEQASQMQDLADTFQESQKAASKKIPDLAKVLASFPSERLAPHVQQLVLMSGEKSALVAYDLAKNPERLARLNRMNPVEAAIKVGELAARLSLPKDQTATRAPSPVRPPKGGTAGAMSPSQEIEAYIRKTYGR